MINKLVLTGAAGRLGSHLRKPLSGLCRELVTTDILEVDDLLPNETFVQADISDRAAVDRVIEGAEMVCHFGSIVDERPFEEMLGPNFVGSYNVWEASYQTGVRRIIYASSIHAVGMYDKNECIGTDVAHRPDTFYGLAKCFTEDLGRMYWEKRGMESVHLRILSALSEVNNARALGSWLSYDDLTQLVTRAIDTPITGFSIIYGVSNNDRCPVDNSAASFLGYRPKDNAEAFADKVLAEAEPADPQDKGQMCHGGPFASIGLGESPMAKMKIVDQRDKD